MSESTAADVDVVVVVVRQARLEEMNEPGYGSAREQLTDLFLQLFRRPLDVIGGGDYQIFWLETKSKSTTESTTANAIEIVAMAILEFEYPIAELKYEFFVAAKPPETKVADKAGVEVAVAAESPSTAVVLRSVGTHPNFRGRGYSRLLLTKLLECAHKQIGSIFLEVSAQNPVAIKLYSSLGFHFPRLPKLTCAESEPPRFDDVQKVAKESCTNFAGEVFFLMRKISSLTL